MKYTELGNNSIKFWAEDDRPREKLITRGRTNLSNSELLAILLQSGYKKMSAVDLAKQILEKYDNDLINLSLAGIDELQSIKGIGAVKAITIMAALEFGKRRQQAEFKQLTKITSSADAYHLLKHYFQDKQIEEFWVMFLNRSNGVLGCKQLSVGGMHATIVDNKVLFRYALDMQASGIILSHNHPSGALKASKEDIDLTLKLKAAAKLLDITIVDHLIITEGGFLSFADKDLF